MSTATSAYRTEAQRARVAQAESVGYEHDRDTDYKLSVRVVGRKMKRVGCLVVLFGRVIGHERAMIVYPDGSVITQAPHRGGSRTVTISKSKLSAALEAHGVLV